MSRVLVVEDEPALAFSLKLDLQTEGYDVETVSDGESAVRRAREAEFDVILLDVMLPRKDGFEALRELRRAGEGRILTTIEPAICGGTLTPRNSTRPPSPSRSRRSSRTAS